METSSDISRIGGRRYDSVALRVLVVDDNEASADTMAWLLELKGHDVRIAYDGANALATALDHDPQLILLDLDMPGLDGFELCRIMQSEHGFKHALFVAQTGHKEEEYRRRAREAGFAHYLPKPVDVEQFDRIIAGFSHRLNAAEIIF